MPSLALFLPEGSITIRWFSVVGIVLFVTPKSPQHENGNSKGGWMDGLFPHCQLHSKGTCNYGQVTGPVTIEI